MIGAALVGGYMLLAPKPVSVAMPMSGGGGKIIDIGGIPETPTKKERDINIHFDAPDFPDPAAGTGGGSRPYDPSEGGWASTAHAKKLEQMQQSVQYQKSLPTWMVGGQTFAGRGNTTASLVPSTSKKEFNSALWQVL